MKNLYFLVLLISVCLNSCKNKTADDLIAGNQTEIRMNFSTSTIDEQDIIAKNNTEEDFDNTDNNLPQQSIDINDDYYMDVEWIEEGAKNTINNNILRKEGNQAALVTRALPSGTRYKLVVFNDNGTFNTERNYAIGSENNTAILLLDRGKKYTFIVYSVGSTTDLPNITFTNSANRTLPTANVNVTNVATNYVDFMYSKTEVDPLDVAVYTLNTTLTHSFSGFRVYIDARQTGYNIARPTSSLSSNFNSSSISLATGTPLTRTTSVAPNIVFPTTNASELTSNYSIINTVSDNTKIYTITAMTIGNSAITNSIVVPNLRAIQGTRYTLRLTLRPEDAILNANAVRIGGQVWQRRNIGANSATPENYGQSTFGGYYQYGYNQYIRTGTMAAGQKAYNGTGRTAIAYWNGNPAALAIRDRAPRKGTADPCPAGFRIPSESEFQTLINNTNVQNRTFANNSYNTGIRLVSKRNSSVRIMFPAQGNITVAGRSTPYVYRGLINRGTAVRVNSSYASSNVRSFYVANAANANQMSRSVPNRSVYVTARPVRCIQGN
ncbi:FISUMP domain-containing protein [Sphingobacterium rhinopitheci]|uniref:FISUMP domain-containing protein n=1 Tax=Sphingobacterium rhinopitheci TaxID=2781960 RepID=UPI001F52AC06|nr:FISUMP domain-containing protein [Sphingobacterium rhinopitheci]MCI0922328.1 hypothetical protein [Sphingobacterium rhinopitheci]